MFISRTDFKGNSVYSFNLNDIQMKYLHIILPISLTIMLFSCKKGQTEFEINGFVYTQSLADPVTDATIEVYKTVAGSTDLQYVSTYKTDEKGNFSFIVKRDKFTALNLKISKKNYFSLDKTIYFSDLSVEEANYLHYFTTSKGWAKIHLKSVVSGDNLTISRINGKKDCEECCPSGFQSFTSPFDTTFYCINDGGTEYSLNYIINNGSNSGTKSVITPVGDTALIEISF